MSKSRQSWTQGQLTKAIKGARAAGVTPTQVVIRDDGTAVTVIVNLAGGGEVDVNNWDDVLKGAGHEAA